MYYHKGYFTCGKAIEMYQPPPIIILDEDEYKAYKLTGINAEIDMAWRYLCSNLSDIGIEEAIEKGMKLKKVKDSRKDVIKKVYEITVNNPTLRLKKELELQSPPVVAVMRSGGQ
ncbi:hypothetical protein GF357_03950 [Candidatus Dojkabacteria bacterium]|nr:hypothetical protein [Candidatus Dojkabacteria bacterium]